MKPLLLLIIGLVYTSNVYAMTDKEYDEEEWYGYCEGFLFENGGCKSIKRGDILNNIGVKPALLYCNKEFPILRGEDSNSLESLNEPPANYSCVYNGIPRHSIRHL